MHTVHAQNGTWTWMHGVNTPNFSGSFGVQGVAAPTNDPPALYETCEWTDLQGNFWIFGGLESSSGSNHGALWKYDPSTNMWTWMNGSNFPNQAGIYGTQGVPAPSNSPGSRAWGVLSWTDLAGDLWLFGGYGYDALGQIGVLNDLWRYNIATNMWTWMSGQQVVNMLGNYGLLQIPAATNEPPPKSESSASWTSNAGDLWMFGGSNFIGYLNDMWSYNINTNMWTWMSGANTVGALPNFGTQLVPANTNNPGARCAYSKWKDSNGNFWLFGGFDPLNQFADMWMYNPNTNVWTWMAGSNQINTSGAFQVPCQWTNDYPSSRYESRACWTDACGRFWQKGGFDAFTQSACELWVFDPSINQFNWVNGPLSLNCPANFGTLLVPSPSNLPPSNGGSVGFVGLNGDLWLFGGAGGVNLDATNSLWRYEIDSLCPVPSFLAIDAGFSYTSSPFCSNDTILFSANTSNPLYTYSWNFGNPSSTMDTSSLTHPSHVYTNTGAYQVSLTVFFNSICFGDSVSSSQVIFISESPQPNLGNDTILCAAQELTLYGAYPNASHVWSTLETTSTITVNDSGHYWVQVNNNGCVGSDSIYIAYEDGGTISPPNVFTPNNDGINDLYNPTLGSLDFFTIQIYDRWGKLVFASDDATQKWDGNFEGKPCSDGVYYWIISFTNCEDEKQNEHGFVQLVR